MVAVFPGVLETIAREAADPPPPPPLLRPARQLMRLDLPTFERPRNANSGRKGPVGGIDGQPAGVTEEPTYSAVLTRISLGVGRSSTGEEEGEEEEEEVEDADIDVAEPFLFRLFPTKLAPATGAAVSARQRASTRVAARSRRFLLRAGAEEEEEASKGKGLMMALPIDRGGALLSVAAGAFFDAKFRRGAAAAAAAGSREDIAMVQLLSIKERRGERRKKRGRLSI